MRILVISPTPTHPQDAGNRIRIFALATALRNIGHAVHFAYIRMEDGDEASMAGWWGAGYHPIPYELPVIRRNPWQRISRRIIRLFDPTHRYTFSIDEWFDPRSIDRLRALDREHEYDVVLVEYVFISRALEAFPGTSLKIIDTHDIFTNRHRLYLSNNDKPQWFSTTRRQERMGLRRADAVIAIQGNEEAFFRRLTRSRVITVGHLVRVEDRWSARSHSRPFKALFVGSKNPINVESLHYFLAHVLPLCGCGRNDLRVLAAGTVCERLSEHPSLEKLGAFSDIGEAYEQADIVINPVRYGTGLNVKTVEALGFGMPVVSTPVGGKGLGTGTPPLLIADSDQEFASAICRIMGDPSFASDLSCRALAFAESWNVRHTDALRNLIESAGERD
jgi:glycosyltransferase involved in cell wall biosynthesis